MAESKLLTAEEEQHLGERVQQHGDIDARNELVERNLALVHYFARRYHNSGAAYEDIVSSGTLGLIRAADKFDPSKGVRFSSYASWWIRQFIRKGDFANKESVKLPLHKRSSYEKYFRVHRKLSFDLQRDPTLQECADAMNTPHHVLKRLLDTIPHVHSLTTDETSEGDTDIPVCRLDQLNASIDVNRLLQNCRLTNRERVIIQERFFNGHTLEVVAEKINLTRERVRQVEQMAITKLARLTKQKKRIKNYSG